jgi:hypothetical protein
MLTADVCCATLVAATLIGTRVSVDLQLNAAIKYLGSPRMKGAVLVRYGPIFVEIQEYSNTAAY